MVFFLFLIFQLGKEYDFYVIAVAVLQIVYDEICFVWMGFDYFQEEDEFMYEIFKLRLKKQLFKKFNNKSYFDKNKNLKDEIYVEEVFLLQNN